MVILKKLQTRDLYMKHIQIQNIMKNQFTRKFLFTKPNTIMK